MKITRLCYNGVNDFYTMSFHLTLPNGITALLEDLNEHDLRQYYMYQMDMLTQIENVLESLGVSEWLNGNRSNKDVV